MIIYVNIMISKICISRREVYFWDRVRYRRNLRRSRYIFANFPGKSYVSYNCKFKCRLIPKWHIVLMRVMWQSRVARTSGLRSFLRAASSWRLDLQHLVMAVVWPSIFLHYKRSGNTVQPHFASPVYNNISNKV